MLAVSKGTFFFPLDGLEKGKLPRVSPRFRTVKAGCHKLRRTFWLSHSGETPALAGRAHRKLPLQALLLLPLKQNAAVKKKALRSARSDGSEEPCEAF